MGEVSKEEHGVDSRRKRINRMKHTIIIVASILLLLPTFICCFLTIKVANMEKQMKRLLAEYQISIETSSDTNQAYAAEPSKSQQKLDENMNLEDTSNEENASKNNLSDETEDKKSTDKKKEKDTDDITQNITEDEQNIVLSTVKDETLADGSDTSEIEPKGEYADKKVYLTFDDGPSDYTDTILDILNEYGVKATFFVTGHEDEESLKHYKRITKEGHTLALHSYSHKYSQIYNSVEDFDKDFTKLWNLLYDTTGYKCTFFRFPGGSANKVSNVDIREIIEYLNEKNITYFDWNVVNGDATGEKLSVEELRDNVLSGVATKSVSVVLMHDLQTKENTVLSLPLILDELTGKGAQILPIDDTTSLVQQIKAD